MKPKIALLTECHVDHGYSKRNLDNITNLLHDHYDLYPIVILKDSWTYTMKDGSKFHVDKNNFCLNLDENGYKIKFDAVLNIIDDTSGENANIQGYLEMFNIPSPNPGMISTTVAFNKLFTNGIVAHLDVVKVPKSIQVRKEVPYDVEEILKKLRFPLIVKPTTGASSYGVTKVDSVDKSDDVIKKVFEICPKLLI